MTYKPKSDPMDSSEAADYIPQWGSYMWDGDPGAIAYSAIPPETAEHRDSLVAYLRDDCQPIAREGSDEDGDEFEWTDVEQLDRAIEYLESLEYGKPSPQLLAIRAGQVCKSDVIGLRKAINTNARREMRLSVSRTAPKLRGAELREIESELAELEPTVTGELILSGISRLTDRRYRKRFNESELAIIDDLDVFKLVRFDRIGRHGLKCVPVYRAVGANGDSFLFRTISWQSGGDGPEIMEEESI